MARLNLNMSKSMVFFLGVLGAIIFLFATGKMTQELWIIFGLLGVLSFLMTKAEPSIISIEEAEKIGFAKLKEYQKKGYAEDGTIRIIPEIELKKLIALVGETTEIIPDKWNMAFIIEGESDHGYLVKINEFGNVEGISRIPIPEEFDVKKTPEYKIIRGIPKYKEELKKTEEESTKRTLSEEE